jgi:hypothetical protein
MLKLSQKKSIQEYEKRLNEKLKEYQLLDVNKEKDMHLLALTE